MERTTSLAINKRALFDYEILETFEAGLVLTGHEAKSVKMRRASLNSAYGLISGGEIHILGLSISPFQQKNAPAHYDPERKRKLLMKKSEIRYLIEKMKTGLTIVPVKLYNNKHGFLKLQIALARGKKSYDKRETIKKRETEREIRKSFKN